MPPKPTPKPSVSSLEEALNAFKNETTENIRHLDELVTKNEVRIDAAERRMVAIDGKLIRMDKKKASNQPSATPSRILTAHDEPRKDEEEQTRRRRWPWMTSFNYSGLSTITLKLSFLLFHYPFTHVN